MTKKSINADAALGRLCRLKGMRRRNARAWRGEDMRKLADFVKASKQRNGGKLVVKEKAAYAA